MNVSNNQLINTIGLSNCINLQYIDLSSNNLSSIDDLDMLPILIELNGSRNNLLQVCLISSIHRIETLVLIQVQILYQMPDLANQILMINLKLDDNSIYKLNELNKYWMPLLRLIELNQNRVNEIDVSALGGFIILNDIQLENNDICDLESIINIDCTNPNNLARIHLKNNPIINDDGLTSLNACKLSDNYVLERNISKIAGDNLEAYLAYLAILCALNEKITSFKPQVPNTIQDLNGFIQNLADSNEFLVKLRYIFEANDTQFLLDVNPHDFDRICNKYEIVHVPIKPIRDNSSQFKRCVSRLERMHNGIHKSDDYKTYLTSNFSLRKLNECAVIIQAKWRGMYSSVVFQNFFLFLLRRLWRFLA